MIKKPTNQDIASILRDVSIMLTMDDIAFKPRAYERAANGMASQNREAAEIYKEGGTKALKKIPGVGASIAEKIEELLKTGRLAYYEKLKKKYPIDLQALVAIEGIGPKHVKHFYDRLRVTSVADLVRAATSGTLATIPGMGQKTADRILKSVAFLATDTKRHLLIDALNASKKIIAALRRVPGFQRMEAAGSIRRMSETVGDIDLLAATKHPKKLMDAFVNLPEVADVEAKGEAKTLVRLTSGFDADLRIVPDASWGAALLYFTGSRDHTLALRNLALDKGYTLNEYGLYTHDKKKKLIAGKTEESIYQALGLQYIPPELREDRGEIAAAKKKTLPALIGYGDLQGDLQVQTDWTDGAHSMEEMARAARDAGLAYIAVTDHTKALAMTHGLDEKRLRKQMADITQLNKKLGGRPHILTGAEVNILKDGTLDIPDNALAALDIVGASVHSHFNLPKKEQTERIIRAMEHPHVDILYHPTGRLIGSRPAYEVDMQAIIAGALRTGTILEINAAPDRLDLKDTHVYEAMRLGCRFAINSDAHEKNHFGFLPLGVGLARRGWVTKKMVVNAYPLKKLLILLKKEKNERWR